MTNTQKSVLRTSTLRLVEKSTVRTVTTRIAMERMNQVRHHFMTISKTAQKTNKGWKY